MAITPGPWRFDGRRWIRDAAGIGVLRVQIGASTDDARAAAAAPALLEALKLAESFMAGFEGDEMQDGIDERLATIRAAILAAEPYEVSPGATTNTGGTP